MSALTPIASTVGSSQTLAFCNAARKQQQQQPHHCCNFAERQRRWGAGRWQPTCVYTVDGGIRHELQHDELPASDFTSTHDAWPWPLARHGRVARLQGLEEDDGPLASCGGRGSTNSGDDDSGNNGGSNRGEPGWAEDDEDAGEDEDEDEDDDSASSSSSGASSASDISEADFNVSATVNHPPPPSDRHTYTVCL
ncbi:hypothetical protein WJX72_010817 [[Myrmecia] bisecta]|uniref:Uncharacterized protein n=1 Tax=[Myrmecia] bisecta TaxID=41462 RepID=A0AAW1RA22_9CHLO